MDYCSIGILTKMLIIFQTLGNFEAANRNFRPTTADELPACLRTTSRQPHKNSFLWNIDKPVIAQRDAGKPAISPSSGDAFHRPKRRPEPSRSYFFGTIHVPYSQVWDFVSPSTKQAFQDADHVIFELDLTNRKTVQALTACQILPGGKNLSEILPQQLFRRLKDHLNYVESILPKWTTPAQKGLGLYAEYLFSALTNNWQRKRPVWVLLMLNSLTEGEIKSRGIPVLDLYLAQEASRLQKQTGAVERVEEQCQPLNEMSLAQVIFALDQSLLHHEKMRDTGMNITDAGATTTEDLVYHYNCGDLNSVIFKKDSAQASSAGWTGEISKLNESVDEYFRIELIQKRNRRMAKRVVELLETHPKRKFFFAFGAGHFLGNHSVIDYMAEMGYNITHLPANYQIKSRSSGRRRNRQRNTFFQADSSLDMSSLNRWGTNEHFLQDTDRILANLRSDYVDDRAYEREQRRKPARISNTQDGAGGRLTTPTANRNFNELWIRQQLADGPSPETPTQMTTISKPHRRIKEHAGWSPASSSARAGMLLSKFSYSLSVFSLQLGVFCRFLRYMDVR